MLEFKGITFEVMNPDPAEVIFCGASFENYCPDETEAWFCGASFEEKLVLDINTLFMFSEI